MRKLPEGMREKVLTAAELFAEHGLDATKMEDIAAATGVPKATLYYYFEGKEDILALLFNAILDELADAVASAAASPGSAAERLRAVITSHLEVIRTFPAASRALQFDLGRAARIPVVAERTGAAFVEPVRVLLVEGADEGSLRAVDQPRLTATAILGAVVSAGLAGLTGPAGSKPASPRATRRTSDAVADLVLAGLVP